MLIHKRPRSNKPFGSEWRPLRGHTDTLPPGCTGQAGRQAHSYTEMTTISDEGTRGLRLAGTCGLKSRRSRVVHGKRNLPPLALPSCQVSRPGRAWRGLGNSTRPAASSIYYTTIPEAPEPLLLLQLGEVVLVELQGGYGRQTDRHAAGRSTVVQASTAAHTISLGLCLRASL